MKATEYVTKYEEEYKNINTEDEAFNFVNKIMMDLLDDAQNILKIRNCKLDSSIAPVIKEINIKFNKVIYILEQKYNKSVMKNDAFLIYCKIVLKLDV